MTPSVSDTLAELRRQFLEQLPAQVEILHSHYLRLAPTAWQPAEAEALCHLLHALTGSAGTFGLHSVSDVARQIGIRLMAWHAARAVPTEAEWQAIGADLRRLDQLARIWPVASEPSLDLSPAQPRADRTPLIYLVEDDRVQAEHLSQALRDDGYRVRVFAAPAEFRVVCSDTAAERPAAVVMDIVFPEGDVVDVEWLAEFKASQASCPPLVVVSTRDDLAVRLAAFRAGACRYMVKPVDPCRLTDLLDGLTGRPSPNPYRVLLVDDDPLLLETHAAVLRAAGMDVHTLSQPLHILDVLKGFTPEVLLLDVYMPEASGLELAAVLRERDAYHHLPILFLAAETDIPQKLRALDLGGDDFLVKPVHPDHLVAAVTARARRARHGSAVLQHLQTALYEREREHQALDQHAIVSVADRAGTITYVNDKFCEISGYTRSELLGQNHRIVRSSEHPPKFYRSLWNTISRGIVWQGEICNRRKDGSLYWVESSITPFLDGDGIPYQYVSIRTDITHVKESEKALRAVVDGTSSVTGEGFFNAAVEGLVRSMGTQIGFISEKLHGDADRLRTLAYWDIGCIGDNFDFEIADTPCENVMREGLSVYPERVAALFPRDAWLRENGIESYLAIPLYDTGGAFLGHMGVMDDKPMSDTADKIDLLRIFAARVAGEIERKQAEAALRASESRLNFLVSSSPVTIYTCAATPPFSTTYVSPNVKQLMGFGPGQFTKDADFWAGNIHPEDRQQVFDNLPQLFEHGSHMHEYRFRMNDGSYHWVHDELLLVRDAAGQPTEIVGYWMDITGRKRAEQAAEVSKERLRRGQMFANIGTWDWNVQTGELYWTERIAPLFGYGVGELETSYDNFLAAIHPDDRQALIDAVNACVERDVPYEIEHRVVWPDGTVRWLQERGAVLRDASGKPLQMLGVVQDIDDRKRAEMALAERERQLREAQTLARIGNWTADLVSGALTWSDEVYRIFGYEPGSFAPSVEAFHTAIHPDDGALVQESEQRAQQTGRHDVVHRIVRPDGTVRHVHELAQLETNAAGRPVRLTGTVQDITERKHAELALQESQTKLSGLFALSPLGIALTDMDGRYLEFNEAFRSICGYPAEELKAIDYWALTPPEYAAQEAAQIESLKKTGRYGPYEKTYRQKSGNRVAIRLNGILVKDLSGQARVWSIVEDITDSKQAEQALIAARDEADRANKAKSDFLSSMSHELRTPMNAILGFGQLMEYDDTLPDEHKDNVKEILKGGHHLLELINEVLDLAKVESGHIDLSLEPVDVCSIVDECLSLMAPLADKRDIQLNHKGLNGAAVRADRTRLKQVLLNLLSNAIKYNREGGGVRLDVLAEGTSRLRIRVTDTGPGIPAGRMAELFQPFNRLGAEGSEIEGSGIGLTITRRIVEMMGGAVGVESEVGVGSTFWIELPLESMTDPGFRDGRSAADSAAIRSEAAQHTVLYIEDNPSNIKLVAQILGHRPHIHLLTAHTPELGIELALARHPELILLDINMPGLDGYQVLEILKAEASLKAIPVVAITANAMTRDIERGKAAGFVDYLAKPLNIGRFNQVVDACLKTNASNHG